MTIATQIGQYRILRKIGAGGMGLVFLGEHRLLGRRAAIKTLLPTVAANQEIVDRFFNEARAASAISDPGVVQIFDFGYHVDGTAYIVMELLEGEALSSRIARLGRLELGEALRIARQLAGSLAAAHAQGIVHRDLKPDNIFLVRDAEAQGGERTKILDFGICKMGAGALTLTESGMMVGTPGYMAPEQCLGEGNVDHRADIYAFGCLLFHMLTGRPPFLGDATGELIVAHLEEAPPAPSLYVAEIPPDVDALLLRCLAKLPDDRYASMTELQQELGERYAELDGTEIAFAAVPPAIPLGEGFRSVYDANVAASAGESSRDALERAGSEPGPWPSSASPQSPAPAQDELDDGEVEPPPRAGRRWVLGGALVAGAAIGLCVTAYIAGHASADGGDAASGSAARTVNASPGATPGATPDATSPALATADNCAPHSPPPTAASADTRGGPGEAPDEAPDDLERAAAAPPPHPAVRSAVHPAVHRAAGPAGLAAPEERSPTRSRPHPASEATEDLYDTR